MIKLIKSDMRDNDYETHTYHNCIDSYKIPDNLEKWDDCIKCNLKPKIWVFDNGRLTACGCWNNMYDHFSVRAESIMSVSSRNDGSVSDYSAEELRLNWNEYCKTGINPCSNEDLRKDGKW